MTTESTRPYNEPFQHQFGIGDVVRHKRAVMHRIIVDIDPVFVVAAIGADEIRIPWQDVVLVRRPVLSK